MKIVLLESLAVGPERLEQYRKALEAEGHRFTAYERDDDPALQKERLADADVLIIANMPLKGEVIRACKKLRFIDVAFTGVDHVDLEACREMGIRVSNASGYSNESVAELTLCMMLSLLRNVPQVEARCRAGKTRDGLVGSELMGKTVGIVGYGAIGKRVGALVRAMGCRVIANNPGKIKDGVEQTSLEHLFETADIVTLHCPLNAGTRGMIGKALIRRMKKDAILINCARGPIVDTQALAEALREGAIAGAGVDVFDTEPPLPADHPLLGTPNTLVTPHVAFASRQSMELRAQIVFHSLDEYLAGRQINVIV